MKSINATHYELIPTYTSKQDRKTHTVSAIIETPKGSPFKFALEPKLGIIALHSVLPKSYQWPYDYGFVPQTLGDDGDPLDILVLLNVPTFSGCMIKARLLGAFRIQKNGIQNDRFIAAPQRMPGVELETDSFETLRDIGAGRHSEIESFLCGYSEAEGNDITLQGTAEVAEAAKLLQRGHRAFRRRKA
jgi:inorganic pyrophosphatase